MAIDKEVLGRLLAGRDPQELFAKDGLLDELKKALSERFRRFVTRLRRFASSSSVFALPRFRYRPNSKRTVSASAVFTTSFLSIHAAV